MLPRTPMLAALLIGIWSALLSSAAGVPNEFAFFHENVLGTSLELRVCAGRLAAAQEAEKRVLGEIDRLAAIFSGYDPTSELSRWQDRSSGTCNVSPSYARFSTIAIPGSGRPAARLIRASRLSRGCGHRAHGGAACRRMTSWPVPGLS